MDDRTYRPADRVAYAGMAGYSLMQGAWVLAAFSGTGFGIFESGMLVGIVLPVFGLAALFGYQGCSREKRFSAVVERSGSGGGRSPAFGTESGKKPDDRHADSECQWSTN